MKQTLVKMFMRYLFIASLLLIVFACNQAGKREQVLQNQIDSLKTQVRNSYKPGFGEFMSSIQVHHNKLWFAGTNQNWKLADFEVNEIQESLNDIKQYCADRSETQSLSMIDPELGNIQKAIQQQNSAAFKEGYINLTNTCNNCHKETRHEFNVITIPSAPPYSNQDFKSPIKK